MQQLIVDRVQFKMPKDLELLFPAMAIVQHYLKTFQQKMASTLFFDRRFKYKLQYSWDVKEWSLFQQMGLTLVQQPEHIDGVDAVFDLTEQKIEQFKDSGKHACQIMGIITGMGISPLPELRKVKPSGNVWWRIGEGYTGYDLFTVQDGTIVGVVGRAGWETYLAASMGLGVIEVLPPDRPVTWLSKFANQGYRVVEHGNTNEQIEHAKKSVEQLVAKKGNECAS